VYQTPSAPLTIGQTLDSGFSLFKASFAQVWFLVLIYAVVTVPFNLFNLSLTDPLTEPVAVPLTGDNAGLFLLFALVYTVVWLVISGAICERIGGVAAGEPVAAGDALRVGLRRGPALFGANVLFAVGAVIMLFLLIIPGLWFTVMFVFAWIAPVLDRKGPIESLSYSFALVSGRWWRTAALLTIIAFVVSVLYLLLAFVAGMVAAVLGAGGTELSGTLVLIEALVVPLLYVVIIPLMYAMLIAVYNEAKLRHEGTDLAARIADATE
jgi:hypothetical protein